MKNPMDRGLEKRLSDRAVAIGRAGDVGCVAELIELLRSSSANVRRLSASALGKLAWLGVDQAMVVTALAPVAHHDPHQQTRPDFYLPELDVTSSTGAWTRRSTR